MATTYILDPSGNIIKVDEGEPKTFTVEGTALNTEDKISDISIEKAGQDIYNDIDIDINNDFASGLNNESLYDKTVQDSPNSPSFGFNSTEPNVKSSYKPLYHFSNNDSQSYNAYFASEFEMLTGFTFRDANPDSQILDATTFIIEYFSEIIVMLGIAEALSLINSQTQVEFTNNTSVAERFSLRMGDYSLQEFDVFSKYMFDVLNYPKDHSNSLSRITALYVGFASWITTDLPVDPVKIIQEAGRKGSHQIQNEYDMDIVSKNENLGLGLGFPLVHIGIAMIEATLAAVSTRSGYKRLQLLTKKFRQEKIWQQSIFSNKSFKGADEENKILVEMNFYYFKFAIERMHVGIKILNRYSLQKTYLNPKSQESGLTTVSASRTKNKAEIGVNRLGEGPPNPNEFEKNIYSWSLSNSDSSSHKPGMTTRLRALPQALQLSNDFLKHIVLSKGENSTLDINKSILQNFYKQNDKKFAKIDKQIVKEIEDYLEAEYVPFYFHDLRTNEVLSFHAFIESISDSFNPEYTSASGFGRIDDVKSYVKTTRNINMSFTVAATSEVDHDFMWYQINKLVTMVYPQWTEGYFTKLDDNQSFTYPFTQVPSSSPLVRIRLGDVIKNNYSRSSLSRIFGVESGVAQDQNFVLPQESTKKYELLPGLYKKATIGETGNLLLADEDKSDETYFNVVSPIEVEFIDINTSVGDLLVDIADSMFNNEKKKPESKEIDLSKPHQVVKVKDVKTVLMVDTSKIVELESYSLSAAGNDINNSDQQKIMKPFNDPNQVQSNNPITGAYESGMSRGIAGFITQLDMNYGESIWETSRIGSKAPMLVKVTLNFSPIHDIVPGIDHKGMMRAPVYNVGRVNNEFFGDSHDTDTIGSGLQNVNNVSNKIKK